MGPGGRTRYDVWAGRSDGVSGAFPKRCLLLLRGETRDVTRHKGSQDHAMSKHALHLNTTPLPFGYCLCRSAGLYCALCMARSSRLRRAGSLRALQNLRRKLPTPKQFCCSLTRFPRHGVEAMLYGGRGPPRLARSTKCSGYGGAYTYSTATSAEASRLCKLTVHQRSIRRPSRTAADLRQC